VGGGVGLRPGEISLAHRGVLFLDEMLEFPRDLLEVLRQPLEERQIVVARANGTVTYPAHFILVGSMNPCPCGYDGDERQRCRCSAAAISRYRKKLSGPLLDRIDLTLNMQRLTFDQLNNSEDNIELATLYDEVLRARLAQKKRMSSAVVLNSDLSPDQVNRFCHLDKAGQQLLKHSMEQLGLSARGYHRVLKVARTIADMKGFASIQHEHLLQALQYRMLKS
jgi:magnesium chelatase family protein